MEELWKPIFDGLYSVSNAGRVRRERSGVGTFVGRILSPSATRKGYLRIAFYIEGKVVSRLVHCLVTEAFIGPKPEGHETNHKDTNKHNNVVGNLEYLSKPDHRKHTVENNLMQKGDKHWARRNLGAWRGENNHFSKLTNAQVLEIRKLFSEGKATQKELGQKFGVKQQHINGIINRKTRTDI